MFIVFFVICLVCISLGIIIWIKKSYSDAGPTVFAISLIALVVIVICSLYNINKIVKANTIEQKIAVYQEEMTNIENSINPVVQNYLDHEKETYTALTLKLEIAEFSTAKWWVYFGQ